MILIPESEFSISWVLLFNTVARAYYYTLPLSTHPPFFAFLLKNLLLLSKSIKKKIYLFKKDKGLFHLPLLKDYFLCCLYQRAHYFIALVKGPFLLLPSPVELITFSMTGWAADLPGCLGFSFSTSSTSFSTSNLH